MEQLQAGWPPRAPQPMGRRAWLVLGGLLVVVALAWGVPRIPKDPVSLALVNETGAAATVLVADYHRPLVHDGQLAWLRIPGGTRVVLDEVPADIPLVVLVVDEHCRVVSPWPWPGSPNMQAGIAAFIDEGGEVSTGSDEPDQIRSGIKDGKAEHISGCD